jgi:hypothetical protein
MDLLHWLGEHRSELAIGLVPALVTAALVWLFGRPVAWWQDRRREEDADQERHDAKRALNNEITSNLAQLAALWKGVNKPSSNFEPWPPLTPDLTAAFRLGAMDPIRWRRAVWEDRAVTTAAALDAEAFARASAFYEDLNRFDVLKGSLGKPISTLAYNWRLSEGGMHAWKELQEVIARRLDEGNPLAEN